MTNNYENFYEEELKKAQFAVDALLMMAGESDANIYDYSDFETPEEAQEYIYDFMEALVLMIRDRLIMAKARRREEARNRKQITTPEVRERQESPIPDKPSMKLAELYQKSMREDAPPQEDPDYPAWICNNCGCMWGRDVSNIHATWHENICDICGKRAMVTEPRDFGHLREGWKEGLKNG